MVIINLTEYDNLKNLSEEKLLDTYLGPKNLPLTLVLPLTVAYVIIFITGVFGNVATCLVIMRKPAMQTATNYYLINLAISDLTLLVLGLPNELSLFWQQYPWVLGVGYCKIRAYASELSCYVSVLTIVAFSMERYLAICHPLHLYAMSGLKRPIRFILAAWSVAIVCAIPFPMYTEVNYVAYPIGSEKLSADSAFCTMYSLPEFPLYESVCIIFFLVPMVIILVLYTRMGLAIRRSNRSTLGHTVEGYVHGESQQIQSRKSVIRMLSAVVVMFFVCWAPFHTQRLLYVHGQNIGNYDDINEVLYTLSGCLYYFSTTVNPILYNVMSAKYRRAFKEMLFCPAKPNVFSRYTSSLRETTLCQCDSRDDGSQLMQIRSPKYPGSVRCTVNHARESLRTPGRVHENKRNDLIPRSRRPRQDDKNGATEPLLDNRSSDKNNGNDRRPLEPSDSTASSTL